MKPVDVCVRGAGAVGTSLALVLARQGLAVVLQAPPRAAGVDVRAYALNAASVALLRGLKVWDALPADAVTPVYDMQVTGDEAGPPLAFSAWAQRVEALAWIVDAAALDDALLTALRYSANAERREDDAPVPAALTALCEGRDSAGRERLGVEVDLQRYGQHAVAARVVADAPHQGVARQWFRSPDVLALLPFDRPEPRRSYGIVWSLPEADARRLAGDPAAFESALNDATGRNAGRLTLAGPLAQWPLARAQARRLHGPGWVLLGDCAHVVHPLAGQGLNLGLGDVAALAAVVAAREPWRGLGDERLLARYSRDRQGPVGAMLGVTDGLLRLFAHPAPLAKELRNRGLTLVDHLPALKRWLAGRALGAP